MAFTFVQKGKNGDFGGGGTINSPDLTHTAGNLLVAWVRWGTNSGDEAKTLTGLTLGDAGPSLTLLTEAIFTGDFYHLVCGYIIVPSTASAHVHATFSSSVSARYIQVWEYDPVGATVAFDAENTGQGTSTAQQSGDISTTGTDEVVFGASAIQVTSDTESVGTLEINGQAADDSDNQGSFRLCSWVEVFSSTFSNGHANGTLNLSRKWICNIAAFKATAGGGGSSIPVFMNQYRQRRA